MCILMNSASMLSAGASEVKTLLEPGGVIEDFGLPSLKLISMLCWEYDEETADAS